MGRPRDPQRKADLLAAATDYAVAHGIRDLSLRPLAAALGTTHRGLLYHFGTKEQLFAAILREARSRERLRAVGGAVPGADGASFADLVLATWRHLSAPSEDRFWQFYFELHGLALQDPDRYDEGLRDGVEDWLSLLEQVLMSRGHPPARSRTIATLVLATFRGLELDLLTTGDRNRVDEAITLLLDELDTEDVTPPPSRMP